MQQTMVTSPMNVAGLAGRDGAANFDRRMPGHVQNLAAQRQNADNVKPFISNSVRRLVIFGTSGLLAFALVLYGLAHLLGDEISRAGHSPSTEIKEIVIANDVLHIPANQIRFRSQRHTGNFDGIEIYLHWPTLSGYTEKLREEFNNLGEDTSLIFLSIEPRSMSQDMTGRIEPIYSLFFEGKSENASNGLIRQPLSVAGGYIDEDLYFEANSPYPFTTRCVREESKVATPYCIRDIHIGRGLMLTYRFHKKFLKNWMMLESSIRSWVDIVLVDSVQ